MHILLWILPLLGFLVICMLVIRAKERAARRKRLMAAPFPQKWEEVLGRNIPLYCRLPPPLKQELHGHIQIFLHEKNFEGCGGLELTDEIKVTIAGQACILLLNRKQKYYPKLISILVYPSAYMPKEIRNGLITKSSEVRLGESWKDGVVVLAWDSVKHGAWDMKDGHNVVFHEFAHQLDQEDGRGDGAPVLEQASHYRTWAKNLFKEFKALRWKAERGKRSVMDVYGAENPAEFFAVATETFFEKPKQLNKKHPELYEELKRYFKVDPLGWTKSVKGN